MAKVILGGTFNTLHRGHRALLEKAFSLGGQVLIGLTSDRMAGKYRADVRPFTERKKTLEAFLKGLSGDTPYRVIKIQDPFTPALRKGLDIIIVSPGTRRNADKINLLRRKKALPPLEIVQVPWVLARDGRPISDQRIRKGEIDPEGRIIS